MPIAALLIPLIPGLVQSVMGIVNAVRADPGTTEETKAQLDALSLDLQSVAAKVAAVDLPSGK